MKHLVRSLAIGVFALAFATEGYALSVGWADTVYPTYGQARHFDQSNEFLGVNGAASDGVSFTSFIPGETASISIYTNIGQLFGSGEFEYLSMWIDWDQDRTWSESEEVLDLDNHWFEAGLQQYQFDILVPAGAVLGATYMRTRVSFDGDLSTGGDYFTGEVEDYALAIGENTNPVPEASTFWLLAAGILGIVALRSRLNL